MSGGLRRCGCGVIGGSVGRGGVSDADGGGVQDTGADNVSSRAAKAEERKRGETVRGDGFGKRVLPAGGSRGGLRRSQSCMRWIRLGGQMETLIRMTRMIL
ncbi:hypothetical protein HPP92_010870 [Vanilla planifolia]|uniref:Uncharacterized protein n=1 Tax=Vanilla planifolia TaxID=51239 RepID=A0A835R616_VANPL|nr:hypothetical protein HPP92_010870 [Vanilla planifolia]